MIRLTASEKAAWKKREQRHKYGAVKTVIDGITFASKAEAKRYGELKMLEKAGEIRELVLQPEFQLSAASQRGGTAIGKYVADFGYYRKSDTEMRRPVIEDVKGMKTALYRWKKKHVEAQYGIEVTEIGCAPKATKAKRAPSLPSEAL